MIDQDAFRALIQAHPELVLEDSVVVESLLGAKAAPAGNVVDLRGALVQRLEGRLGALEDTHRNVLAAAYENLAGTQQIQRAVLALLEPTTFGGFLAAMRGEVADILAVDSVRLALELTDAERAIANAPGIVALPLGGVSSYIGTTQDQQAARITLRATGMKAAALFEEDTLLIKSEALMRLDLGEGRRAAMLSFGATDADRFAPDQGTDLLEFFTGCYERAVRRWLS